MATPADEFNTAIAACVPPLRTWVGLRAVESGEGKGQIDAQDSRRVMGSVRIDKDCRRTYPTDNRWDYAIGYDRHNAAFVYFVEAHSVNSHDVSLMERKLAWLGRFLLLPSSSLLLRLPHEFHWLASGKFNIPRHVPQYRQLQKLKKHLKGPSARLVLK